MVKEIKISLPLYKIVYAVFFIVVLSLIRGVSVSWEIGIALEAPMAILAAVFCADTYAQEIISKRSEVWRLYQMKRRIRSVAGRIAVQEAFLLLLGAAGYGLFFLFQKPQLLSSSQQQGAGAEMTQFFIYLGAVAVCIFFWGILSNTVACIFRNIWAGIGGAVLLWIGANSTLGDRCLGSWNVFSYTFRKIENTGDLSWLYGKGVCMVLSFMMLAVLPGLLKKRG